VIRGKTRTNDGDPAGPSRGRRGVASGASAPVKPRKSKRARWRAAVLIAVHVLIAAHATHYLLHGRTLSPVEPSESMYTLEQGQLNAGFVFFAVALLVTAVFGRFFCGWGCHLVALQDLCGWLMRRLGVRPRPFRSRLLLLMPLLLAVYMFVWPTAKRVAAPWIVGLDLGSLDGARDWVFRGLPADFPGLSNHLVTGAFWSTFPGPVFAGLTFLTCGFVAVYVLGAKGFCTYACPYGGFFGVVDRFAPGRIRVTSACEQCGHCTATCTSNVLVHEEVRRFGMVVDPGCMKCMDCVSVCPNDALYFGFGRPASAKGAPADARAARRYPLGLVAEGVLALVFVAALLAFRGLYDGPPLLLSACLAALTAYVALMLVRLVRQPTVRLQNLTLRAGGALSRSGLVALIVAVSWLAFAAHSAFVQGERFLGAYYLEQTEATRADVLSGAFRSRTYSAAHTRAAAASFAHFAMADRWGLLPVAEVKLGLAWGHLLRGEVEQGEAAIEAAIEIAPASSRLLSDLAEVRLSRGDLRGAIEALEARVARGAPAEEHFRLATMLVETGEPERAVESYRACLALAPDSAAANHNLGGLLRRLGRPAEAVAPLETATRLMPDDPSSQIELGLTYAALGRREEAARCVRRAIELAPDSPESRLYLPGLLHELEAPGGGDGHVAPPAERRSTIQRPTR